MITKSSKSSIKRVARGRRYIALHRELDRGSVNHAFNCHAFPGLLDAMFGPGKCQTRHEKYYFSGWGIDCKRSPDKFWVTCPSPEAARDLLHVMRVEKVPFNGSFSKYVNIVRLEDGGRTILALG